MRVKISIILPSLRGGGAEKVMLNIVKFLDRDKYDITLILLKKEGPYVKFLPEDIKIIDLDTKRVRHSIKKLINAINDSQPNIIFSTLGHLNLVLLFLKKFFKNRPKIIVREANTPSYSLNKLSKFKKILFLYMYKKYYPKADTIIAQCEEMKKDIIEYFELKEEKVMYIYNPIDINYIKSRYNEFNPFEEEKFNIVAIGRLTYQKGFDLLIESYHMFEKKMPNSRLTILGQGELETELNNKIQTLKLSHKVSIINFQENPYPYYKNADMYVLSSRWEGFPNTLLEALACNTQVVATNCKSGPTEILDGDKYGYLANVGDTNDLFNKMLLAYSTKKEPMNRANFFSIDKIIAQYDSLFSSHYTVD